MTIEQGQPATAEPAIMAKPKSQFQIMLDAIRAKQTPWEKNYFAVMANPEEHLDQIGREQLEGVGREFEAFGNAKAGREAYGRDPDFGHPIPKRLVSSVKVAVGASVDPVVVPAAPPTRAPVEIAAHHPRPAKHHTHHSSVRETLPDCVWSAPRVVTAGIQ